MYEQDVTFDERLEFDVEDRHCYVNVCLWCKQLNRVDKQGKPLRPEKDTLIGQVSSRSDPRKTRSSDK